jgi:hypothetical protein
VAAATLQRVTILLHKMFLLQICMFSCKRTRLTETLRFGSGFAVRQWTRLWLTSWPKY